MFSSLFLEKSERICFVLGAVGPEASTPNSAKKPLMENGNATLQHFTVHYTLVLYIYIHDFPKEKSMRKQAARTH